ncbi:MAG TPA: MotA/TolQ/ExbB proton channel family protein [Polyangiaceae bacterium]
MTEQLRTGPGRTAELDPIGLMLGSSGVVLVVLLILLCASTSVWLIWFLKSAQLRRLRSAQHRFERETLGVESASELIAVASRHAGAPGARVVFELAKRHHQANLTSEFLLAIAKRAIASEQQRVTSLMPTLSSIASASPFIGLFGTVWGIMDAFLRIGVEKSASLPVVAPAIGEALIATAFGLVAAIPATIGFNYIDKRITDLLEELGASAEASVLTLMGEAANARSEA